MITYQQEFLATVEKDIRPLLEEDYEEIEQKKSLRKLNPDFEAYAEVEVIGGLKIFTCRDDGVLVGYMTVLLGPDLHDKGEFVAAQDVLFLTKSHRKGMTGVKLIRFAEKCLKEDGYKSLFITTTTEKAGKLMGKLGYQKLEEKFEKEL